MKVSAKLIVGFIIVIVLAILVGAAGILGMSLMNKADNELYNGNYLPTVMAGDISQKVVEQRVYIRNFAIYDVNEDAELFKQAEDGLTASRKEMDELLKEYDLTIANEEDRAAYKELSEVYYGEWKAIVDSIRDLGAANKTSEAKEALTVAATVAAKMNQLSTTLQQVNLSDGQKAVDSNATLFTTMTTIEIIVLAIAVIVAIYLAFHISGLISKPLVILTSFMKKAGSTGDITLRQEDIENINRYAQIRDETGQCISSTANFLKHITSMSEELGSIADGDLTVHIDCLSERDTMGVSMRKMVGNLNSMFSEISSSTAQVNSGSGQIADGAQALAQGSTEQAAAVEQLSASISEIAQKTKDTADMAGKAAALADTIKTNAEKGGRQMDEMIAAVNEINQASQSINKVIKVIDDIAFQTNILALNAAVEAARAGQHGKGFAVVAEEVRSLAAKSAEAAKDTGGLIANSMEKAELGTRIADETAASLLEIVDGIKESNQLIGEIAKSSEDQSLGISQINIGIDQVAQVIQQNSATAEESAAASEEMSGQASMLEALVAQFKLK